MKRKPAPSRAPSLRERRVGELIRHTLAELFARGACHDPELAEARLTFTEVRMSPDLRHARVYFRRLGRRDAASLLPALARAQGFLRHAVAEAVQLKFAPELHFEPDTALDRAEAIEALLRSPSVARDLH
jgi:ribosome-binding factor A